MSEDQPLPHANANYRLEEAVVSLCDGVLRARDYDDVYFDTRDGLAESRYVFIEGNDLVKKLQSCNQITIAETGFGTD